MGKKVEWNWHWKSWKDKLQPLSSHFTGGGLMRIPLQMCCFIIDISQRVFLSWLLIRCVSPAALIVCLPKICSIKRLLKGASSLISVWQNRVYEIFHDAQRINSIFRLGYVGNCYFSNFCFLFSFFSGAASETRRPHEGPENLPWKSMVSFVWWNDEWRKTWQHTNVDSEEQERNRFSEVIQQFWYNGYDESTRISRWPESGSSMHANDSWELQDFPAWWKISVWPSSNIGRTLVKRRHEWRNALLLSKPKRPLNYFPKQSWSLSILVPFIPFLRKLTMEIHYLRRRSPWGIYPTDGTATRTQKKTQGVFWKNDDNERARGG